MNPVPSTPTQVRTITNPRWLWHFLVIGTLLSAIGISSAAWILGQGKGNPKRASNLIWTDTQFLWADGPEPLSVASNQIQIFTAPKRFPTRGFSVEIAGQIEDSSDELVAWGIWLETSDNDWLIVAINGAQFVTARRCPPNFDGGLESCQPLLEPNQKIRTVWKTFHHIRPIGQTNYIHLDYLPHEWSDGLTLRLNDEWMWDIPFIPSPNKIQWGIWVHGGLNSPAQIQWINAQVWQD